MAGFLQSVDVQDWQDWWVSMILGLSHFFIFVDIHQFVEGQRGGVSWNRRWVSILVGFLQSVDVHYW